MCGDFKLPGKADRPLAAPAPAGSDPTWVPCGRWGGVEVACSVCLSPSICPSFPPRGVAPSWCCCLPPKGTSVRSDFHIILGKVSRGAEKQRPWAVALPWGRLPQALLGREAPSTAPRESAGQKLGSRPRPGVPTPPHNRWAERGGEDGRVGVGGEPRPCCWPGGRPPCSDPLISCCLRGLTLPGHFSSGHCAVHAAVPWVDTSSAGAGVALGRGDPQLGLDPNPVLPGGWGGERPARGH